MFDCWYLADVDTFTFDGNTVTTKLTDGSEQTHTYEYLGSYQLGEGEMMTYGGETFDASFPVDVYKTADDAGEFSYFLFRDDTMQTTWHIEFRYGSDLDQLLKYMEGPYAYWLSAGIDADASPETIDSVIDLFVSENLGRRRVKFTLPHAPAGQLSRRGISCANWTSCIKTDMDFLQIVHDFRLHFC